MIVPSPRVTQLGPGVPAGDIAAISPVDGSFIGMSPVEVLAKPARQNDVGVKVEDPVLRPDLVERPLDQPCLVERPVAPMLFGEHVPDRHLLANPARLMIVRRRDDHQVVNERAVDTGGFFEEVPVPATDRDCLDLHPSAS